MFKEDEEITLRNFSDVSQEIYSSIKNLYLESDSTKCADELYLLREYNCGLVVDATTKKNGQNTSALRDIAKISGIDICFGYTLKEDFYANSNLFNFDKTLNDIRYEIAYGFEDLIPSFLGEIIISDNECFPNENEFKLFEILFKVIEEFKIPILIKLNYTSFLSGVNRLFLYFENKCDQLKIERKLIVFIYSKSNTDGNYDNDTSNIIQNILAKGFSLIIGMYDCDLVLASRIKKLSQSDPDSKKQFEDFFQNSLSFDKNKLKFVRKILESDNKKYLSQIMISNNINFKLQLKKYGGFGYNNLFRNYFNKIVSESELTENEVNLVFSENLLNLLSWWEPPKKTEKRVKYITCSR